MESQEDRFIRQFMLIEDDRKERGFDQRSIERKQRVMPQGQIDLGIYPSEDNEEPSNEIVYGFSGEVFLPESSEINEEISPTFYPISANVSNKNARTYFIITAEEDIVITNSKIGSIKSENGTIAEYTTHPATFNNCSFYFAQTGSGRIRNSTFYRCDFDPLVNELIGYLDQGASKADVRDALTPYFDISNTYTECKTSSIDDYPELQD